MIWEEVKPKPCFFSNSKELIFTQNGAAPFWEKLFRECTKENENALALLVEWTRTLFGLLARLT